MSSDALGLIRIGFDELLAALRSQNSRCLFGFGESDSDNRAHEALALALKNPLMNRGRMLSDANHVLVQISGGPGMTLTEVEIVMQELNRHVEDHTQILFGTSVDGKMGNRLSVTLISSISAEGSAQSVPSAPPKRTARPVASVAPPYVEAPALAVPEMIPPTTEYATPVLPEAAVPSNSALPTEPIVKRPAEMAEVTPAAAEIAPPPPPARKERKPAPIREPEVAPSEPAAVKPPLAKQDKYVHARQEVMQFEPITRGRFEKSEPTIVEGQDLDVPTYLRKNVRVK